MPHPTSKRFFVVCLASLLATLDCVGNGTDGTQASECTGGNAQAIVGGSADASYLGFDDVAMAVAAIVVESDTGHPSLCSGILVAKRFVLTAAHCAPGTAPIALRVSFGPSAAPFASLDPCALPATYPVVAFEIDPDADVMLVELASGISPSIPVVPVATASPTVGQAGVIAGYGVNEQGTAGERLLVGTTVVGVGPTVAGYSAPNGQADAETCAGDADAEACSGGPLLLTVDSGPDAGACGGDSGGPLLVRDTSGWKVAGVLSEGSAYCTGEDVYVDLASVAGWIAANTKR